MRLSPWPLAIAASVRAAANTTAPTTEGAKIRKPAAKVPVDTGLSPGNIRKNNPRAARTTDRRRFIQPTRMSKPFQGPKDRGRVLSQNSLAKESTCPASRFHSQETGGK